MKRSYDSLNDFVPACLKLPEVMLSEQRLGTDESVLIPEEVFGFTFLRLRQSGFNKIGRIKVEKATYLQASLLLLDDFKSTESLGALFVKALDFECTFFDGFFVLRRANDVFEILK